MAIKNGLKFKLFSLVAKITRVIHPFGTERFLRLIYHPDKRASDYFQTIIRYDKDLKININSSSFIEWRIFFYGFYEIEVVKIIKKLIKSDFICFDVGANIGAYSLVMAKNCGKVFAFEPRPVVLKKFLDNLALNKLNNVIAVQMAISDFSGQSKLYFNKNDSNQGTASLNESAGEKLENIQVEVATIDKFVEKEGIKRLDLIKSDTEGNDYRVLLGAKKSIFRFRPYLLFEYEAASWNKAGFNLKNLKELLSPLNYDYFEIGRNGVKQLDQSVLYANILAVPK